MAQIATREALFSALTDPGGKGDDLDVGSRCEGLRVVIWDNSGWQTKLGEAERLRAQEMFFPCDKKSLDSRYKCFSIPLHEDEQTYCKAARAAFLRKRVEQQFSTALDACVSTFAEAATAPTTPAGCDLTAPSPEVMSKDDYLQKKASCDAECASRAPDARKKYLADAPKRAANTAKCRRCFLAPASESKGIESWCDSRVAARDYQSFVTPACDSTCANRRAYDVCVKK